jgi:predicted PurR-regulated permease PerM
MGRLDQATSGAATSVAAPGNQANGGPPQARRVGVDIPPGVQVAAAWSWRILTIVGASAAVLWTAEYLRLVLIPLAIALLLSALLAPAVGWVRCTTHLPQTLATIVVMAGGLIVVAGTLTLVITQFVSGLPTLVAKTTDGIGQIQNWLKTGPLHLSNQQLSGDAVQAWFDNHRAMLTSGALSTAGTVLEVVAAGLLVLFATFFFLRDGDRIWQFVIGLLPSTAHDPIRRAGKESWLTLAAYVRATVVVAAIDAVGIGLALLILRVPFAFPLAALVFLSSFVPIIGASVSGVVAVLVALVTRGPLVALIVLIAVIVVQQLEGHVLQPVIMGRAVSIHPLAVIVSIATGLILAGIIGALVAVPVVAVLNSGVRSLLHGQAEPASHTAVAAESSS